MIQKLKPYMVFTIVALSVFCWRTPADCANQIIVGYIEFPPIFSTANNGSPEGILIDLGRNVLKKAGFKGIFKSYPTKRMALYLAEGEIHLWLGLPTLPEFKGTTHIGTSTLLSIELRAYTVTGAPPVKTKDDLNGKSILLMRGYSYGGWIGHIKNPANHITYHEFDTHESAFLALNRRKYDYLLDYHLPSEATLQKIQMDTLAYNSVSSFDAKFVVSKKAPDAENLLMRLEAAFQELYGKH